MAEDEVRRIWGRSDPPGIATVSGRVSGNLGLIDFDRDAHVIYPRWAERVEESAPGLTSRLCVVQTPRQPAGFHVRFRVAGTEIPGNEVLAQLSNAEEPNPKMRVLIETRGKGGYALAPGSPLECHESRGPYQHVAGPPLTALETITTEEFDILLGAARSFDRTADEGHLSRGRPVNPDCRPGDQFDREGWPWADLLAPLGWKLHRQDGGVEYWTRPGKQQGVSASTGYCKRASDGAPLLKVFSSSAAPLEAGKAYGRFAFFALMQHNGDHARAAADLRRQGFGGPAEAPAAAGTSPHQAADIEAMPMPLGGPPWPAPARPQALHGLAGDVVRVIGPQSESDEVALLVSFLVGFGNLVGRDAHVAVEATRHHANEFVVLVGQTAKARKGTSWNHIRRILRGVDESWAEQKIVNGLVSGEGLVWEVRDPIRKREKGKRRGGMAPYEEVEVDPGVEDKRLLVVEEEFATVLKAVERQGNTLSPILREAWDGKNLRTMAKNNPARATAPHVSVIGHITVEELRRCLSATEVANGLGNRHLWFCVRRSKLLPEGGSVDEGALADLVKRTYEAARLARQAGAVCRDEEARDVWRTIYGELSEGRPGISGALLARAEAHVTRLSLIYALLDKSAVIRAEHLCAAVALWEYVVASVVHVFGAALGDPLADEILRLLRDHPRGANRSEIRDHFGRHQRADQILRALACLQRHGLARAEKRQTGGRPCEVWLPQPG